MGNLFGLKLLNELSCVNVCVKTVIVIRQPSTYYLRLFNYVRKRVGLKNAVNFSIKRIVNGITTKTLQYWNDKPFQTDYNKLAVSVFESHGTNSQNTVITLKGVAPDLLLLGETGIVRKEILQVPRLGTLNAHPGILPFYRGIDCAKWAILNGDFDKIGATVHWVDEGVDTGPIIETRMYKFLGNESLDILEDNLDNLGIRLMAEIVQNMDLDMIPYGSRQADVGKQYYKMPVRAEKSVRGKMLSFSEENKNKTLSLKSSLGPRIHKKV